MFEPLSRSDTMIRDNARAYLASNPQTFTLNERRVLAHLADGCSLHDISSRLDIDFDMAMEHLRTAMLKMCNHRMKA